MNKDSPVFEVLIAGAGPAACASAIALHDFGIRVAMVDSVDAKRPKVGESIPAASARLLNRLGIQNLSQILDSSDFKACMANAAIWGTKKWVYKDAMLNPEGNAWLLNRNRFDEALRQYAINKGVTFIQGQVGFIWEKENSSYQEVHLKGTTTMIPTKWVIDATGRANRVSKIRGIDKVDYSEQMAVIAWLNPTQSDPDQVTRIKAVQNGWWYTANLPDESRVIVFHALVKDVSRMTHHPHEFIQKFNETGILNYQIKEADLKYRLQARNANVSKLEKVAEQGFMAVGDAALSFDPLSSQGIFFALYSGIKAAEAIKSYHQTPQVLEEYTKKIEHVFHRVQIARQQHYNNIWQFRENEYWKKQHIFTKTVSQAERN